jgi:hypothetical protein
MEVAEENLQWELLSFQRNVHPPSSGYLVQKMISSVKSPEESNTFALP